MTPEAAVGHEQMQMRMPIGTLAPYTWPIGIECPLPVGLADCATIGLEINRCGCRLRRCVHSRHAAGPA